MSGLILIWNRDGAPGAGEALGAMRAALPHRAVDGADHWLSPDGAIALAHLHFWTTPEELGERQPLVTDAVVLAFDGRVDNRADLAAALGLDGPALRGASDAALVLRAFGAWGGACFERIRGPFAAVAVERGAGRVVLARDAVGERTLACYADARRLVVASEPFAVARHPDVPADDDDVWWAHYHAVAPVGDGRTRFAAVRELMPAHVRVVDRSGLRDRHYWQPDPVPRLRYRHDDQYAEHFLDVMGRAVDRRLRAVGRPAVLMSGGLDSSTIAALAAERLAPGRRLRTYSYVFDAVTSCDERPYIAAMVARHGLDSVQVVADGAWTFARLDDWPHNPNEPDGNFYRDLMELVFGRIRADGARVVLAGYGADELFAGMEDWLRDLLAERRFRAAGRQLADHLRRQGVRRVLASQSVRRVVGPALARLGLRRAPRPAPPRPWLTPWAAGLVPDRLAWPPWVARSRRPNQHEAVLGAGVVAGAGSAGFLDHWRGIDLRRPYLDRDVVEFFLQLPAHQLFAQGRTKAVVRCAMRGRLPEAVRGRRIPTSFRALYSMGLREHESGRAHLLLARPDVMRARFVHDEWLARAAQLAELGEAQDMALWRCLGRAVWMHQKELNLHNPAPVESWPVRRVSPVRTPPLEART